MAPPVRRRGELDGLRGLGALLVLWFHLTGILGNSEAAQSPPGGFLGVDVFFPISGLLITGLLLSEHERSGRVDLRAFYHRRVRRLAPALGAFLLGHLAWVLASHRSFLHYEATSLAWVTGQAASFGQQRLQIAPAMQITWSLAIEEQFYLLWPVLLLLALRAGWSRAAISRALVLTILGLIVWRTLDYTDRGPAGWFQSFHSGSYRGIEILVGCLIALQAPGRAAPPVWLRSLALVGLVALVPFVGATDAWLYEGGILLVAVLVGLVIAPGEHAWWGARLLSWRPFAQVGRMSYSIYLWHSLGIVIIWEHTADWSYAPRAALCAATGLAMGIASYVLFERPGMAARHATTGVVTPARVPLLIVAGSVVLFAGIGAACRDTAGYATAAGAWVGLVVGVQLWMGVLRPRRSAVTRTGSGEHRVVAPPAALVMQQPQVRVLLEPRG